MKTPEGESSVCAFRNVATTSVGNGNPPLSQAKLRILQCLSRAFIPKLVFPFLAILPGIIVLSFLPNLGKGGGKLSSIHT